MFENMCATQGPDIFRCLKCNTIFQRSWFCFCPKCGSGSFQHASIANPHKYALLKNGIWELKEEE